MIVCIDDDRRSFLSVCLMFLFGHGLVWPCRVVSAAAATLADYREVKQVDSSVRSAPLGLSRGCPGKSRETTRRYDRMRDATTGSKPSFLFLGVILPKPLSLLYTYYQNHGRRRLGRTATRRAAGGG